MSAHDDYEIEPVRGLPEQPPQGEELLWQGRPAIFALARDAFKLTWVASYFLGLAVWQIAVQASNLTQAFAIALPYLAIGLLVCAILLGLAARVAMRIGSALTVTLNLPFKQIGTASLALKPNGTGTIALQTLGETRISYLVCWPHARPWVFAKTQPALRCIPDAARVAKLLSDAAETKLNEPMVAQRGAGLMLAAAE